MSQPPSLSNSGLAEVTPDDKMFAMIAHLSTFIAPMVMVPGLIPGVIYLMKKDTSPFIAYHALQAVIFQIAYFAFAMVIAVPISVVLSMFGCPCGCIFFLGVFACIPFAIKANNGDWTGYPLISGIGRPPGV